MVRAGQRAVHGRRAGRDVRVAFFPTPGRYGISLGLLVVLLALAVGCVDVPTQTTTPPGAQEELPGDRDRAPGDGDWSDQGPGEQQPPEGPYCDTAAPEICDDDMDNDCDGMVDEGCTCTVASKACYSGDPADLAVSQGACRAGTQRCEQEFYTACEGEVLPTAEVCDGIDNDCNGAVDDIEGCDNAAPVATCPSPQSGTPLANYWLTGTYEDADGDAMARATWRVLDKPVGSGVEPTPTDELSSSVFADLQGIYVLELEVEDSRGAVGRCTTQIEAITQDGLRIELSWNVGRQGDLSDVDLHMRRPGGTRWFDSATDGDDCYYANCSVCDSWDDEAGCRELLAGFAEAGVSPPGKVTWFPPMDNDDPRLDLDDVQGNGPENINVKQPRDGVYRLGIHYFDAEGSGDAVVNVNIFCAGELVTTLEPTTLRDTDAGTWDDRDFWEVADIQWQQGTCNVTPFGERGCRQICTTREAMAGGCPQGQERGRSCR